MPDEVVLPVDLPHPDGQTFVIYSKLQRVGSASVAPVLIPSAPRVEQSVGISSVTGIASASGGLDNDVLKITPVVSNGELSWEILGKQQMAAGNFSFRCTVTTNGEEDVWERGTLSFTFRVILFGKAHMYKPRVFYFKVGDSISELSVVSGGINPLIDYGASVEGELRHGTQGEEEEYEETINGQTVTRTRFAGYRSGFHVYHYRVWDGLSQRTTDIRLNGTAARPGVYVFWTYTNQWGEGGKYDYYPQSFPPGNNAAPVIVSIYDTELPDGAVGVLCSAGYDPTPVRHVVHYGRTRADADVAEAWETPAIHLTDAKFEESGGTWTALFTENPQSQSPLYFEYQLVLDDDTWILSGRMYARGEAVPSWTELDRADNPTWEIEVDDGEGGTTTETVSGELPPVHGWRYATFRANPAFYLEKKPEDDPEDETSEPEANPMNGFYVRLGDGGYQQMPVWTPQYEGIWMPPEYRCNSGYIVTDEAAEDETRTPVAGSVIPYAPPVAEYLGTTPLRDVALDLGDTLFNVSSDSDLRFNGYGIFPVWHDHRRFVPGNGSSGDVRHAATVGFGYHHIERSSSHYSGTAPDAGEEQIFDIYNGTAEKNADYSLSMECSVGDFQSRSGAELADMLYSSGGYPSITVDTHEKTHDDWATGWGTWRQVKDYERTEQSTGENRSGHVFAALYPVSGIRYEPGGIPENPDQDGYAIPRHSTFTAASGDFNGSGATKVRTKIDETYPDDPSGSSDYHSDTEEDSTWGGGGAFQTPFALPITGDELAAGGVTSYSGTKQYNRASSSMLCHIDEDTGETVTDRSESYSYTLTWTGGNTSAGGVRIAGSATCREVAVVNGVTTETITDDPYGDVFAARKAAISAMPQLDVGPWKSDSESESENATTYSFGGDADNADED